MPTYSIPVNTPTVIDVNQAINNNSNGYWKIVGNTLVHDNCIPSYIDKEYPFLTSGKQYRITYTSSNVTCSYRIYLGATAGILNTAQQGTYLQIFTFTGLIRKLDFGQMVMLL